MFNVTTGEPASNEIMTHNISSQTTSYPILHRPSPTQWLCLFSPPSAQCCLRSWAASSHASAMRCSGYRRPSNVWSRTSASLDVSQLTGTGDDEHGRVNISLIVSSSTQKPTSTDARLLSRPGIDSGHRLRLCAFHRGGPPLRGRAPSMEGTGGGAPGDGGRRAGEEEGKGEGGRVIIKGGNFFIWLCEFIHQSAQSNSPWPILFGQFTATVAHV